MGVAVGPGADRWWAKAIPEISGVDSRKAVAVLECGEPLVSLEGIAPDLIVVSPEYQRRGYRNAVPGAFARRRVAEMLREAARQLPPSRRLMVWDAWRPTRLQEEIFLEHQATLRRQHPGYDDERLARETEAYVSLPSRDPSAPAPHSTGGAVDVTICDATGTPVEMGTDFDHFGPEAATRHLEERLARGETLNAKEREALDNRRLLYHAMTRQGFTNYREEWWHFDFGDQFWGRITGNKSVYAGRDSIV